MRCVVLYVVLCVLRCVLWAMLWVVLWVALWVALWVMRRVALCVRCVLAWRRLFSGIALAGAPHVALLLLLVAGCWLPYGLIVCCFIVCCFIVCCFVDCCFVVRCFCCCSQLALTVLLPLMFVYGATAAVYGRGALDGLGVESLKGQGGMSWYVLAPCVLLCPCGL